MDYVTPKRRAIDLPYILFVALMAAAYLIFAWANFLQWRETGRPVGLGLMVQEALIAVLFVIKRRPTGTSRSPLAWIATIAGTFGILLVRPHYEPVAGLGGLFSALQVVGVLCALISLGWLGRSFGLVAANRGVKVDGPYRIVRHPVYASYVITYAAYLLENPLLWNVAVFAMVMAVQLIRINKEEEFLSKDPTYAAYKQRVRYRLLPGVY